MFFLEMLKSVPHSSGLFFDRCESEINVAPSQAYFLRKRRGGLSVTQCHLGSVWTPSSHVWVWSTRKELTHSWCSFIPNHHFLNDDHNIVLLQWYRRKVACVHTSGVKHQRDTRLMWRTAFFSYRNGEWVQVTSDHIANHYTLLAHAYAATKASSPTLVQVSSIALPTECSLAVTLPSS